MVRVLIIDDSAFMRKSISLMLESDPEIKIAGTARNGEEGLELVKTLKPDIITLDIEMPGMNGLEVLEKVMKNNPTPVIMISSLTTEGADSTLRALELGAVDFIPKELSYINVNIIKIKEDLIRKVKEIVKHSRFRRNLSHIAARTTFPDNSKQLFKTLPVNQYKAVAIGISTGGPMSLQKIFPLLSDKINCPLFIVQHMPPRFTKSLAERLNNLTSLTVKEAEHEELIANNTVYIAPGGFHMTIKKKYPWYFIDINEKPDSTLHRPSVDVMFTSVAECYGKNVIGVIMTGMGRDGTVGIKAIKKTGGYCLAQNEESCVVYGMPKSVIEAGLTDSIAQLNEIPIMINKAFGL